jgi:hypothetical protein
MSQHTKKEPTNREILKALQGQIQGLEQKMDERFDAAFEIFATKEDLKDAVSGLVTKDEFNEFKNETYDRFDRVMTKLNRLDVEEKAHLTWLQRHDKALEKLGA